MVVFRRCFSMMCQCLVFYAATASMAAAGAVVAQPEPEIKFPLPRPSEIGTEKFSQLLSDFIAQGKYNAWHHDLKPRFTGPYFVRDSGAVESFGTHGPSAVQVYYSPEVWTWLNDGRKGTIADGGIILKVLFARNPDEPTKHSPEPTGFSAMVKDSKGSWDGWFYSDGGPQQKPARDNALNFFDPNVGYALSCVNCHAAADNVEGTFSSLRNVTDQPIQHTISISLEGLRKKPTAAVDIHTPAVPAAIVPETPLSKISYPYANPDTMLSAMHEPIPMALSSFDHVPQGPRPNGQQQFVTASNCMSCHDAVQLYSAQPNMVVERKDSKGDKTRVNLSPYSEWRYSMMGLSGRDPIFFAQLDSERTAHPELAAEIDNKCLGCHAPMGQRQWKHDFGATTLFPLEAAMAEPGSTHEKYGALGRDGVSCMVCHQMVPEGLGDPKTYGGNFVLQEKPTQVYGPYEKSATVPMEQALGLTPKQGPHISDSKMCASCHTIALPVLDAGKKYSGKEFSQMIATLQPKGYHEQTTYLEWKNSIFSTENPRNKGTQRSCQDCHMQRTFDGAPLKFRVANIEDDTFPPVDNRASDAQLHLEPRDRYSRHALHGINVFALELFNQNPWLLGVQRKDNLFPGDDVKSGFDVAIESSLNMARTQTAKVELLNVKRSPKGLTAQVKVINLTGHKFPSGVNFRRAFIEFKVQDGDKTVWASGETNKWGAIGLFANEKFTPLKTEFLPGNAFQPHHQIIEREDEVQIYEALIADSNGNLTTSFLNLKNPVKDNRLQPRGWKADGPNFELTRPLGTGNDKDYQDGEGKDIVTYDIPLTGMADKPLTVSAALYYQSLPPYYLQQRFNLFDKPDTQRLYFLVNQLDLSKTEIQDWKLLIARDMKRVE